MANAARYSDPHVSVFLDIPESDWVASNAHAFAVRDRYPVSRGHTLVVTRRLVADWFAASDEERRAVLALVDVIKGQLDEDFILTGTTSDSTQAPRRGRR